MKLIVIILSLFCVCPFVYGYNILAVFPNPMFSHYTLTETILKELVRKGHHVTVVSPYPQKTPIANFTDISIASIIDTLTERKKGLYELESSTLFSSVNFLSHMGYIGTELAIQHPNVQKLLKSNEKFDLLLTAQYTNEATMAFANHFKTPTAILISMPPFAWGSFVLSHPSPSSYVPNLLSAFTGRMTFYQRFLNTLYDIYSIGYHNLVILPKYRNLVKNYFPGSPDLYDFVSNVSLVLINSHYSVYDAIPRVPNAFDIGGFHVQSKPLTGELKEFLDLSKNGVVVFSMGSNLKSSDLSEERRTAIINCFRKIKQNVIWKWESEDIPNLPKNVKIMKWLPLQDILGHPNVVAFLTHGGLLSTIESIYHGVPLVGMPVFADQKMNIATACAYGYARQVPLHELTEKKLYLALDEILNNPKYRENAKARSRIMRDRPMHPLDEATYWIEYVIRHKGAPHLRYPGMDLNWFQRHLLDVLGAIALMLFVAFIVLKRVFRKLCCSMSKSNLKNKKNQ